MNDASEVTPVETWQTSEAGQHLRTLLEGVRRGQWQLVGDRDRATAVLADADEICDLLRAGYSFRPQTASASQRTEIWLPEVGAHVVGATPDEARRELAEAMITYAGEWEMHLQHTIEQRLKAGYVRRIQLAGDHAGVLAMLDGDAQAESDAARYARPAPGPEAPQTRHWMGPRDRLAQLHDARSARKETK